MNTIKMPDITQAQIAAGVAWIVGQAVAMGVIDNDQSGLVLQVATSVLAAVWVIGDAIIRNGRSRALINPPKPPTDGDSS